MFRSLIPTKLLAPPVVQQSQLPEARATRLHDALLEKAGTLIQALDSLQSDAALKDINLSFPQIVVAGSESSGKSTLLERIAGHNLFPRDARMCTRMPIRVQLRHMSQAELQIFCAAQKPAVPFNPEGVYTRVKAGSYDSGIIGMVADFDVAMRDLMNKRVQAYRNGKLTGVIEEEAIIEITSCLVPNLQLIDLPGIVCGRHADEPADIEQQTRNLVEHYISQPHTMVLAVIPAFERIRNAAVVGLVQKHRKEASTLVVLTMADRANGPAHDRFQDVRERVDGTADDCIACGQGVFAVRNRDTRIANDPKTLSEAAAVEKDLFESNMPGYYEAGKVGSNALIQKLVEMMCQYVTSRWIPDAEKKIETQRQRIAEKLKLLGTDPSVEAEKLRVQLLKHFQDISVQQLVSCDEVFQNHRLIYRATQYCSSQSAAKSARDSLERFEKDFWISFEEMVATLVKQATPVSCETLPLRCARFQKCRDLFRVYAQTTIQKVAAQYRPKTEARLRIVLAMCECVPEVTALPILQEAALRIIENFKEACSVERLLQLWGSQADVLEESKPIAEERKVLSAQARHLYQVVWQLKALKEKYQ